MSEIKVKTIEPSTGTNLTLGTSGDTIAVSSDSVKLDIWKDSGGNTLFQSDGAGTLSNVNSSFSGAGPKLILSQTADASSSISFTSGIDNTYDKYMFVFFELNPVDNAVDFRFQVNASGQTGYDEVITSSAYMTHHYENDSSSGLAYTTGYDQADGTAPQIICENIGNQADECGAGELHLFNPASTTYVKNFYSRFPLLAASDYTGDMFTAGYINTTSAIDEVQFSFQSGNFDGTIKLYGVT